MRPRNFVITCVIAMLLFLCFETTTFFAFGEDRGIPAILEDTTLSAGACPSCSQVAGDWNTREQSTLQCLTDGQQSLDYSTDYSYLMTVWQNGCNVSFSVAGNQGSGLITGSSIQISGYYDLQTLDIPATLTFTQNSFTLSGTVSGNTATLHGSAVAAATFYDEAGSLHSVSCTGEISVSLRRSIDVPVAGHATLISPSGTIATHKPTYSWNAVADADCYLLAAQSNVTGAWPVLQSYSAAEAGCSGGTGTCSVTPSLPVPSGSCTWYVQTGNSYGFVKWSSGGSFIVNQPVPTKPILIAPTGNIETNNPTYSWYGATGAEGYQLAADDSTGQWPVNQLYYSAAEAGCSTDTGVCSVTPSIPLAPGTCRWYVRAWNYSDYGPWSDEMTFAIPPGEATPLSPSGSTSTTDPTFSWNAVAKADYYQLAVKDSTGSWPVVHWYSAAEAGCGSGTGLCSVNPQVPLKPGVCTWYVQTYNSYGLGPWSDGLSFGVLTPDKATLASPVGNIGTNKPTYTWNAVNNADYYQLAVNDSSGSWPVNHWYRADEAGCGSGTGLCSLDPQIGLAPGSCTWYIQTYNSYGVGFWSDGMSFSVP